MEFLSSLVKRTRSSSEFAERLTAYRYLGTLLRDLYDFYDTNPFRLNGVDVMALRRILTYPSADNITVRAQLKLLNIISDLELTVLSLGPAKKGRVNVEAKIDDKSSVLTRIRVESAMDALGSDGAIAEMKATENIVDVAGTDFDSKGESAAPQSGTLTVDTPIDKFFDRFVELGRGQWEIGQKLTLALNVWNLLALDPTVRAKFRNFAYFRGNLRVRVVLSGTPFHAGKLLVSYQPLALWNDNLTNLTSVNVPNCLLSYLSQAPHSYVMDVKENKPFEILIPYICPKPNLRLFNDSATAIAANTDFEDFDEMGSLYLYSLNALAALETTATPVYYQVYGRFESVHLGTNTGTQLAITTEAMMDERKVGPVERISSKVAKYASYFSNVPTIGPFAMASSTIASGISAVAAIFGWSRPTLEERPHFVKNQPYTNSSNAIGFETVSKLSFDPKQEITPDPRYGGTAVDPMSLREICARKSFIGSFEWRAEDEPLNLIRAFCVTPLLSASDAAGAVANVMPSSLAFAASMFEFWRGKINFRLEFVTTAFHRGKFQVFWEPNLPQAYLIASNVKLNRQYMALGDLAQSQTYDFCIEWANDRMWLRTAETNESPYLYSQVLSNCDPNMVNGWVGICPYTELQSPDASPVQVNVYVWSDDIQFNCLTTKYMNFDRRIVTESMMDPTPSCVASVDVTCIEINPTGLDDSKSCVEYFGEEVLSLRSVLHRWVSTRKASQTLTATTGGGCIVSDIPIYPPVVAFYGIFSGEGSIFDYVKYAFLGRRGGMRARPRTLLSVPPNPTWWQKVTLKQSSTTESSYSIFANDGDVNTSKLEGTLTFSPMTNTGVEVELPFYTNNLFLMSFHRYATPSGSHLFEPSYFRNFSVISDYPASDTQEASLVVDQAIAEDFTYLRYQGPSAWHYTA